MELGQSLIDKAAQVCGSDAELARRLGVHRVVIAEMRSGKRAISPATAAELADIAGDDAREAAIAAVIESAKGTRRESRLRDVLGKALAAGVAGVWVFSYSDGLIFTTEKIATAVNSLYIVFSSRYIVSSRKLRAMLDRSLTWGRAPYPRVVARSFAIRSTGLQNTLFFRNEAQPQRGRTALNRQVAGPWALASPASAALVPCTG